MPLYTTKNADSDYLWGEVEDCGWEGAQGENFGVSPDIR